MARINMPHNCAGLTMEDGTRYGCRPGGAIEVEKAHHLDAIRKSGNAPHIGKTVAWLSVSHAHGLPDNYCPKCSFNAYPWHQTCPRCGTALGDERRASPVGR